MIKKLALLAYCLFNRRIRTSPPSRLLLGLLQRAGVGPAMVAVGMLGVAGVAAAVEGGAIAYGNGTISTDKIITTVNQTSQRMVINWQNFDIARGDTVHFDQPSATAEALNRVNANNPTQILGNLTANGRVYIVNPAGVMFGPGAKVDVGALVASSLSITDQDFMSGNRKFVADGEQSGVSNSGTIDAAEFVAMLGSNVRNELSGTIKAGSVALAAADAVTMTLNSGLQLQVDKGALAAIVNNAGKIKATGTDIRYGFEQPEGSEQQPVGSVTLTAVSRASAEDSVTRALVNNEGVITANSVNGNGGRIVLEAGGVASASNEIDQHGVVDASGSNNVGGQIGLQAEQINISADSQTTVGVGGRILTELAQIKKANLIYYWTSGMDYKKFVPELTSNLDSILMELSLDEIRAAIDGLKPFYNNVAYYIHLADIVRRNQFLQDKAAYQSWLPSYLIAMALGDKSKIPLFIDAARSERATGYADKIAAAFNDAWFDMSKLSVRERISVLEQVAKKQSSYEYPEIGEDLRATLTNSMKNIASLFTLDPSKVVNEDMHIQFLNGGMSEAEFKGYVLVRAGSLQDKMKTKLSDEEKEQFNSLSLADRIALAEQTKDFDKAKTKSVLLKFLIAQGKASPLPDGSVDSSPTPRELTQAETRAELLRLATREGLTLPEDPPAVDQAPPAPTLPARKLSPKVQALLDALGASQANTVTQQTKPFNAVTAEPLQNVRYVKTLENLQDDAVDLLQKEHEEQGK